MRGEKLFDALNYVTADGLGSRSPLSQDIGRLIDRSIGLISRNPCRGCDNFYEQTHGISRELSGDLAKVEPGIADDTDVELNGLVLTCREKLPETRKGEERFKACNSRWGQGQRDQMASDFERWSKQ